MLIVTRTETEALLDLDELRGSMADAMAAVSGGRVSMPARIAAEVGDRGVLLAMPAYLAGGALATKLVSLFPGNAGTGVPTHQAVVVVFDADHGQPVALLDGTAITTARTAAASALATDLLARADSEVLAVLGTGVQARAHAQAVVRVRAIREIRVAGRNAERVAVFADELRSSLGVAVAPAESCAAACRDADVVCAATHADTPVVQRSFLAPGAHVNSVGYNTAGRELDSATVAGAVLVVESRAAVLAAPPSGSNDIRTPIDEGLITPEHIHAELGELVSGARPGRTTADQLTVYKSVGVAAQDVAAASLVIAAARAAGVGTEVAI